MKECPACHRCFPDHVNHCPSDGDLLKFSIHGDTVLDGRYQLEKKLGQGGMGMVFKARHVFLKTQHAVKIILPDLVGNDPTLTTRFRQEAMAAAAIRHPNTISVTDYGIIHGTTPFLVMEFVEGRSLHELLVTEKRLPPARALDLMLAVCAGVAAAHKLGIVHRDLKPLNILIKPDLPPQEGVKVLDFGLAKIKSGELLGSFVAAQTQGMMGSPFYMAPEQWSDDDIDVRADIYSLGVILYQMLAGEVPFRGASIPAIMNKHLTTAPAPLVEHGLAAPAEVERAVAHALEKDPARRPASVEAFMDELRAALDKLDGAAAARTIPLASGQTLGLSQPHGHPTGVQPVGFEGLKTIPGADAPADDSAGRFTAPPAAAAPGTDALPADPPPARPTDTARQQPERTSLGQAGQTGQAGAEGQAWPTGRVETPGWGRTTPPAPGDTPPAPHAFAGAGLAEESRRRDEEEQGRLEAEARAGQEAEERRRLEARQQELRQAPATRVAEAAGAAGYASAGAAAPAAPSSTPRTLLVVLGVVFFVGLLGGVAGGAYYLFKVRGGDAENVNAGANANAANANAEANANGAANANAGPQPTPEGPRPDLVVLPGGAFRVGRDDVPQPTDELRRTRANYLLWMYSQWPAHAADVRPFAIDRTEVTNAEYALFVAEAGHPAPPGWEGGRPPAGEEQFPVVNVSYEDAVAFARWRSEKYGERYRLPSEEEWEFAARGGDPSRAYPWGDAPPDGRANLGAQALRPVGSFPDGRTPEGVEDMLGNVWEWTRSEARMYAGNNRTVLSAEDNGKMVVRGGSYTNRTDGDEPIAVTSRRWLAKDFRSPQLGFRLVRPTRN